MAQLKFIADSMLGSLARKLRLLGIDTAYSNKADHNELKYLLRSQNRLLLTKDQKLARSLDTLAWSITGKNVREEFVSISGKLADAGCKPDPFSLCLQCNIELVSLESRKVKDKVPPYIIESTDTFMGCPSCGKVYWEGTHKERMKREVEWMKEKIVRG